MKGVFSITSGLISVRGGEKGFKDGFSFLGAKGGEGGNEDWGRDSRGLLGGRSSEGCCNILKVQKSGGRSEESLWRD